MATRCGPTYESQHVDDQRIVQKERHQNENGNPSTERREEMGPEIPQQDG